MPAVWMNYAPRTYDSEGGDTVTDGRACIMSIVLDGGSREYFSGIRLLIVRKEIEGLKNVVRRFDNKQPFAMHGMN
jgi:hypothetical protein